MQHSRPINPNYGVLPNEKVLQRFAFCETLIVSKAGFVSQVDLVLRRHAVAT